VLVGLANHAGPDGTRQSCYAVGLHPCQFIWPSLYRGGGDKEPAGVALDGGAEEGAVRLQADEHEGRGSREPAGLAAVLFAGHDGGEPPRLAVESDDVHAGVHGELGIGPHPLLKDGSGGEAGAGQDPDPVSELGQVQPSSRAALPPPMTMTSSAPR
jgi:hypothetical protein